MRIEVDPKKCTGCGMCQEACPKGPKIWKIGEKADPVDLRYCHVCTLCASKCPQGAIKVIRDDENGEKEKIGEKNHGN